MRQIKLATRRLSGAC